MSWLIQVFVVVYVVNTIYAVVTATTAHLLGITVREVSLGIGPALFKLGCIKIACIPLGSSVQLKDSREEQLLDSETADACNHQPRWKQTMLFLIGPAFLLYCAMVILQMEGWTAFILGFQQILLGAAGPFSTAQELLGRGQEYAATHLFIGFAALVTTKLSAQIFLVNSGRMLTTLITRGNPSVAWETIVLTALAWFNIILLICWALAFGCFVWQSFT